MNAGVVLNAKNSNSYAFCKIEITKNDHPNGFLVIGDVINSSTANRADSGAFFTGSSHYKLNVGTTYTLTFWQTVGGANGTGTYHCTVWGKDIYPETISWDVPTPAPNYDLAGSRGTSAGLRIKVGETSTNEQDSGATRFRNFNLSVYSDAGTLDESEGPMTPDAGVSCPHRVNVYILVFQFFSVPASYGCWGFQRIYQNAGQGNQLWKICYADPSKGTVGTGPNAIYNDTGPDGPLQPETDRIVACGNLKAEYMLYRLQDQHNPGTPEQWCTNHLYPPTCWRRNPGSILQTVYKYFAELYHDDSVTYDYTTWQRWTRPGAGANPNNSSAVFNIRPDVYRNTNDSFVMYSDIYSFCRMTKAGGFMSLYAGQAISYYLTVTPTDVVQVSNAMNACDLTP